MSNADGRGGRFPPFASTNQEGLTTTRSAQTKIESPAAESLQLASEKPWPSTTPEINYFCIQQQQKIIRMREFVAGGCGRRKEGGERVGRDAFSGKEEN